MEGIPETVGLELSEEMKEILRRVMESLDYDGGISKAERDRILNHYLKPYLDKARRRSDRLGAFFRSRGMYDSGRHGIAQMRSHDASEREIAENVHVPLMLEEMRRASTDRRANLQQAFTMFNTLQQQALGDNLVRDGWDHNAAMAEAVRLWEEQQRTGYERVVDERNPDGTVTKKVVHIEGTQQYEERLYKERAGGFYTVGADGQLNWIRGTQEQEDYLLTASQQFVREGWDQDESMMLARQAFENEMFIKTKADKELDRELERTLRKWTIDAQKVIAKGNQASRLELAKYQVAQARIDAAIAAVGSITGNLLGAILSGQNLPDWLQQLVPGPGDGNGSPFKIIPFNPDIPGSMATVTDGAGNVVLTASEAGGWFATNTTPSGARMVDEYGSSGQVTRTHMYNKNGTKAFEARYDPDKPGQKELWSADGETLLYTGDANSLVKMEEDGTWKLSRDGGTTWQDVPGETGGAAEDDWLTSEEFPWGDFASGFAAGGTAEAMANTDAMQRWIAENPEAANAADFVGFLASMKGGPGAVVGWVLGRFAVDQVWKGNTTGIYASTVNGFEPTYNQMSPEMQDWADDNIQGNDRGTLPWKVSFNFQAGHVDFLPPTIGNRDRKNLREDLDSFMERNNLMVFPVDSKKVQASNRPMMEAMLEDLKKRTEIPAGAEYFWIQFDEKTGTYTATLRDSESAVVGRVQWGGAA